ncbi:hypothetical protein [Microbacterium maritypicum]|uniref:Uncharacterized protein n=1 Tax=Microbacterium maritypicum TaxID=33918 RepID=A0A4Y4B571_MICMQ|nr:hypothetical protein [Microbacterium liquefaciens]GEC75526.1 hypothetical protein MLI01_16710 [Microbacterium liquefaciens]GGV63919.1 hypothetical protein GCM10010213_29010 [Microbacterium liquefaciens]
MGRKMTEKSASRVLAYGLAAWITAPVVLFAVLTTQVLTAADIEQKPIYVAAMKAEGSLNRPISLSVRWSAPLEVVAPAWNGLVQQVLVKPGDVLKDGTPVVTVSGVKILAAVMEYPLARPLSSGDVGPSVRMLSAYLNARGQDAGPGDRFDDRMLAAVRGYAAEIGVEHSNEVTAFDPGWVLYVASERTVTEVELTVATPVPNQGTTVMRLAPQATEAVLVADGAQAEETTSENNNADESAGAAPSPDGNPPDDNPSSDAESGAVSLAPVTASPAEELIIGGEPIPLDDTRTRVSDEGLSLLSTLGSATADILAANLVQDASDGQWLVPAASLISSGADSCVFVQRVGKQMELDATAIVSISGKVAIKAPIRRDDKIVVFPLQKKMTCDSS